MLWKLLISRLFCFLGLLGYKLLDSSVSDDDDDLAHDPKRTHVTGDPLLSFERAIDSGQPFLTINFIIVREAAIGRDSNHLGCCLGAYQVYCITIGSLDIISSTGMCLGTPT